MDLNEFKYGFDVLYNNISNNQAPGVNDYEKSLFLTETQDYYVEGLYNGTITGSSFEETEELRRKLDSLIKTAECDKTTGDTVSNVIKIEDDSVLYDLPGDVLFITMEQVEYTTGTNCTSGRIVNVKPVTQDEYNVIKRNPFRGVTDDRALRLDCGMVDKTVSGSTTSVRCVEVMSKYPIQKYKIRYLSKPSPIILCDLPSGVTISGESTQMNCKLDSSLHKTILERAVLMALRYKGINTEK